jgi:integrase
VLVGVLITFGAPGEGPPCTRHRPASDEALKLILANVEKKRTNKRGRKQDYNLEYKRLLLGMLYETGLRITDLPSVEWKAIDLTAGRMTVRIAKTDKVANIPLSPVVTAMLANLTRRAVRLFPWVHRSGVYHTGSDRSVSAWESNTRHT